MSIKRFLFPAAVFIESLLNKEVRKANSLLEKGNSLDFVGIQSLANRAFMELVNFARHKNPYYKAVFDENDLHSKVKTIDDIAYIPILTKDQIKGQRDQIVTPSINTDECITRTSGGTTGEPIYIEVDKQARINELYAYFRGLHWMGWRAGDTMVKFFGGSLSGNNSPTLKNKIKKYVSGEIFLPAFSLTAENANSYLEVIRKAGPVFLQGYVSSVYSLALYTKQLNFKGLKIKGAFTTAEQLPVEQAEFISDVFGCEVKSFFGCAEINCIGFQSSMHGPHVVPGEIVHVESIDHPVNKSPNAFLISSLFNKRTPLLRYLNGDHGTLQKGEKYIEIMELQGRTADMFVRENGTYVSSIVATQTMQITGLTHKIKKYQLVQRDLRNIDFYFEEFPGETLGKDELNKIISMYSERIGKEFHINSQQTDNFIQSSSGKHRLMINLLS